MSVLERLSNKSLFEKLLWGGVLLSCVARILVELFLGSDLSIHASIISILICGVCLGWYYTEAKRDNSGLHDPENVYYMGLLFTLASLVYSLITLFIVQDNANNHIASRVHNLIGSFGIALISTFLGILLRILLMQDRQGYSQQDGNQQRNSQQGDYQGGLVQINSITPVNLADAAFRLRRELTQTIADMGVFRGAIVQATHETVDEASKACATLNQRVEETVNEQTKILSTLSTTTADKLAMTFAKIATSVENVQESLSGLADKQIQRVEETANEQTRILSALSTTTANKLAITLGGVTASVENVQKSLDDMADKQVQRTQQAIDLTERSTREMANGMQNSLRQIDQSTAEIATTFDTMLTPLQSVVSNLQSTSNDTENLVSQYASLNANLQQSLTFFTSIEDQMKQATNALTASTQAFSSTLSAATEVTPQYTQQFEQLIKTLRQEAEQWQSMTQEVRSSLVQAIDELTQLVKRS